MTTPTRRAAARSISTAQLQRAVVLAAIAVLAAGALFGAYYYWDRYVRLGDQSPLDKDIAQLQQAIRADPTDPAPRVALAEYYLGKEMYPAAFAEAKKVLAGFPDDSTALLVAGIAQARQNRRADAVPLLEKTIALRQDGQMAASDQMLETAYYFLGESQLALNHPAEALAALEGALAISPTDADALWQAGLAAHALAQDDAALKYYQRAVRLVPDFAEAYAGMIDAYTQLGQPDYVAYARGMQAFSQADYATALTHLEAASRNLPDFAPAFLGLGLTYEKAGRLGEALTAVERALALDPQDFVAAQAQGRLQAAIQAQGG